jgi:hypothetical protein
MEVALNPLFGELNRQSFMLAVNDAFFLDSLFFFSTLVLVLFLRRLQANAPIPGAH